MARVPTYQSQVGVNVLPGAQVSSAGVSEWSASVGAKAQGLAQVGNVITDIGQKMQKEADEAQLMDFENKISSYKIDFLSNPETGAVAQRGEKGLGMTGRMFPEWERSSSELASDLNPRLRSQANALMLRHGMQVRTALQGMELNETDSVHKQRAATGLLTAQSEAIAMRGNPGAVDAAAARAMQYATMDGERMGLDADTLAMQQQAAVSGIYKAEIEALIDDDTNLAENRLAAVRSRLTPQDQLLIDRRLLPVVTDRTGHSIATQILGGVAPSGSEGAFDGPATQFKPSDALEKLPIEQRRTLRFNDDALNAYASLAEDRYGLPPGLINALKNAGEKSNSGQVSPAGARGVMQFMPENLRKYGVKDATDPVQMIDAAGRYLRDTMRQYGGNVPAVIADYNGGPNQAKRVLKGEAPAAEETRKYLARVSTALGAGGLPRSAGPHGVQITEDTKPESLFAMIPASASRKERKVAEGYLRDMLAVKKTAILEQQQAQSSAIYAKVVQLDPEQPLSKALSHDELTLIGKDDTLNASINRYRKLVSEGQIIKDDDVLLDSLNRLRFSDPDKFKSMPLAQYADRLSGKTLLDLQGNQETLKNPSKSGEAIADWASESEQLGLVFDDLGIPGGQAGVKRRADFTKKYHAEMRAAIEANGGKKLNADQRQKLLDRLTMTGFRDQATWYGGTNRETKPLYAIPEKERAAYRVSVPQAANDRIVQRLKARGLPVNEQAVRDIYLMEGVK